MKKDFESGRSMVEMLGTLAIIGVLSVGGIAGYSYGMDKYRANTIIKDIMLRAVDAMAQFDTTGNANLSAWPTTTASKYTIGLEDETIGIQVNDLPKSLCKMVYEEMKDQANIKFNATIYGPNDNLNCGDTNTMVFYVDETAKIQQGEQTPPPTECTTNADCTELDVCMGCIIPDGQETGVCEYACQEVAYLESDGGQYILTNYIPNSNTAIEIDYYPDNSSAYIVIYGSIDSLETNRFHAVISATKYRLQINSHSGNWFNGLNTNGTIAFNTNGDFTGLQERVKLTVDNYTKQISVNSNSATFSCNMGTITGLGEVNCTYPMAIFNRTVGGSISNSNAFKGRIYSFKIWESGTLLRNFTPILDPEGVPAMLDLVEEKLYYNQGSGQFTYDE